MEPRAPELKYNLPDSVILPERIKAKLEEAVDGDPAINQMTREDSGFASAVAFETQVAYEIAYKLIQRMCDESSFDDQLELANVALFDYFPMANQRIERIAMGLGNVSSDSGRI